MTRPASGSLFCPCGSQRDYQACCGRFHGSDCGDGQPALPETAEQLMRSRFSAFRLSRMEYVAASWHPNTRPADLAADPTVLWSTLVVRDHRQQGDHATVDFDACFYQTGEPQPWGMLQEHSRFVREQGRWWYLDGDAQWSALSPGRNDGCPCGSGRKFKKCCFTDQGAAFVALARRAFQDHAPGHHQRANDGSNQ